MKYPVWMLDMPPFLNEGYRKNFLSMRQVKEYMQTHDSKKCPEDLCHNHSLPVTETLTFHKRSFSTGLLVVVEDGIVFSSPPSHKSY